MSVESAPDGSASPPSRTLPTLTYPADLPVSQRREDLLRALKASQVVVVVGETGSGKTTQLPKMLLEVGALRRGVIGHTQPRRIAARAVAARLAAELPDAPPKFVGHKIRFNDGTSRETAIKVMTDGILLAESRHDPLLRRYDAIILDEAHERSLNIDFLLGCLKRILARRRDLKLVITSATIDSGRFSAYFNDAPVIEVSGRSYPVETRYRPLDVDADDRFDPGLNAGIVRAIGEILHEPGEIGRGDILVFLPGEREIREAAEAVEQAFGPRLTVLPLYSRLAWAEQQRIFDRRGGQRVVLATNVAEASLTVPGIRSVIDSGLARLSRYSPRTKLLRLPIEPVSQASANQRRGRCGRIGPGLCVRLFDEEGFALREPFTPPEVLRTNLASVILQMEVLGLGRPADFPFIDPPDTRLINDGYRLLEELEAVSAEGKVTELGRTMARFPVDPRFARMLLAARQHQALNEVLALVAGLSIQDPRERPADRQEKADAVHAEGADSKSDLMTLLLLWHRYRTEREARSRNSLRRWCAERFLSASRMREWEELESQLRTMTDELGWTLNVQPATPEAIHRAVLTGLLGHVGMKTEKADFLGPRGRRFLIAPGSPLKNRSPRWIVAAHIVETQRVYARLVAAVEPVWIESAARHLVRREYTDPEWEEVRGMVSCRETVTLWGLPLVSGRRTNYGTVAPREAREVFAREALVHGRARLKLAALQHNRQLKTRLAAEEAALRRHTVLIEESDETALYVARLPETVHSVSAFERWRKTPAARDGDALKLSESDLRQPGEPPIDRKAFPLHLLMAGNRLPVRYRFEPQEAGDGAIVTVPVALVPRLSDGELAWGIPGWRAEKVTAIIRGLPKPLRRLLVPAPDAAAKAVADLDPASGLGFFEALSASLTRLAGQPIDPQTLAAVEVEPYLNLGLEILDGAGRCLVFGREIADIKRELRRTGGQVQSSPAPVAPNGSAEAEFERTGLREFDFTVVPTALEVKRQGVRLALHPTLLDEGDSVRVTLVADAETAQQGWLNGCVRLWSLSLAPVVRHAQKLLMADKDLMLLHQGIGSAQTLARDLVDRAVRRECWPDETSVPLSREAFAGAQARGQAQLVPSAERLGAQIRAVLTEYRAARAELAALPDGCDAAMVDDLRIHLAELVYEGFVARTPDPWLEGFVRYVKALRRRVAKLPSMRGAVADAQFEYFEARKRFRAAQRRAQEAGGEALLQSWRWHLEEYAIQLFAQDLRTKVPVSAKRLAMIEASAEAALRRQ